MGSCTPRVRIVALLGIVLSAPSAVCAQPWTPPQGQGSVSVLYHHIFVEDHLFAGGVPRDVGHIRSHAVSVDLDFAVTDRLAVRAVLPYVSAAFEHGREHQPDGPNSHSGLQDFRAEVRYSTREFPVAVAPFVTVTIPTHDYEFFAHSAIGLNMMELQVGTYLGILKGPVSLQGRGAFGVYERVAGHRRTRTNFDAELALHPSSNLRVFLFQAGQISHDGVELPFDDIQALMRAPWWRHHDQIGRAHVLNGGGGVSVALTDSLSMYGSFVTTLAGANTHAAKYGFTTGTRSAYSTRPPESHERQ